MRQALLVLPLICCPFEFFSGMATVDGSLSARSFDQVEEYDVMGVINALERICEIESKLRQAVQQTHPLTTTLDWDFATADKEREALLAIR